MRNTSYSDDLLGRGLNMLIQEPSLLARLPTSITDTDKSENIRFNQVYGLQGSRKRKRFEVAAAVNGEAILIYNVCLQRLPSTGN